MRQTTWKLWRSEFKKHSPRTMLSFKNSTVSIIKPKCPNIWAKHMRQRAAAAHKRKRSSISSVWQSKVIYPYLISLHIVKQCLCEHTAGLEQAVPQTARTPAAPLCRWSWRGRSSPLLPHRSQGPGTPPDPGSDSAGQRAGSTHRSQD